MEDEIETEKEHRILNDVKVIGMSGLEKMYSCFNCKKGMVKPKCSTFGNCEDCKTFQRLDRPKVTCKLFVKTSDGTKTFMAYKDVLNIIIQQDQDSKAPITCESLITAQPFNLEYNEFNIIKSISR